MLCIWFKRSNLPSAALEPHTRTCKIKNKTYKRITQNQKYRKRKQNTLLCGINWKKPHCFRYFKICNFYRECTFIRGYRFLWLRETFSLWILEFVDLNFYQSTLGTNAVVYQTNGNHWNWYSNTFTVYHRAYIILAPCFIQEIKLKCFRCCEYCAPVNFSK